MANTTIIVPTISLRLVSVRGLRLEGGTPTLALTTGDVLNISSWDDGWPTGFVSNVDEAIAAADGSTVSTTFASDPAIFDLSDSFLTDFDTITGVDITLRAEITATGTGGFDVELLIGGVSQGTESPAVSGAMSNYVLSNAGWDQDWTEAQLDAMQVRVTSRQDTSEVTNWAIDCMDVEVAFTPAIGFIPAAVRPNPVLTGYAPDPDVSTNFKHAFPPAVGRNLSGKAPTTDTGIAVDSAQLNLAGKFSYLNSLTEQLQPNGWDNGWLIGYISNIDEPVAVADGSYIATTNPPGGATTIIDLDDVTAVNNLHDVLSVTMTVRAQAVNATPTPTATLALHLLVQGNYIAFTTPVEMALTGTMTNFSISLPDWNVDWTVFQLNSMQLQLTVSTFPVDTEVRVDCIDVIVEYALQSPKKLTPAAGALALSPKIPTLEDLRIEKPLVGAVTLAGKVPAVVRHDQVYPSADHLLTSVKGVARVVDFLAKPAIDTLVTAGKIPATVVDHLTLPAVKTLALAGEIPVADTTAHHVMAPLAEDLVLFPRAPLLQTLTNTTKGPVRGTAVIAGKVPVLVPTGDILRYPAEAALTITAAAPSIDSPVLIPASVALSLTVQTPLRVPSTVIATAATSLALSGHLPALGPLEAQLVLTTYVPVATVNHIMTPAAMSRLGSELVDDPEFLIGKLTPWTIVNFASIANGTVTMINLPPTDAVDQSITVVAGQTYTVEWRARVVGGDGSGAAIMQLDSAAFVSSGADLVQDSTLSSTWVTATITFVATTASVFIRATFLGGVANGQAEVDFISLKQAFATPTLSGKGVSVDNASASPAVGTLALTGYAPTMSFSTALLTAGPKLISVTEDRALQFIATPTDILIG